MGKLVVHAGRPKAGSTSIERWLKANAVDLRQDHDISLLVALPGEDGEQSVHVAPAQPDDRHVNSRALVEDYLRADDRQSFLDSALEQIEAYADRHRAVIVTSEWLSWAFSRAGERFLRSLDRLARRHAVEVAHYLRPQHTALEAAWRQWGFRSGQSPSEYLAHYSGELHYHQTYEYVRERAPEVSFEPRPMLASVLAGGDLVCDFAQRFLGLDEPPGLADSERWNTGLPLDLVNAIRSAPPGYLWTEGDNTPALKRLMAEAEIADSEEVRLSRLVLHSYAHEVYEADNARLAATLGWGPEPFVPPPPEEAGAVGDELALLDELWEPKASEAELQLLHYALSHAITRQSPRPPADAVSAGSRATSGQALAFRRLADELTAVEGDLARTVGSRAWRVARALGRARRTVPAGDRNGGRDRGPDIATELALHRVRRLRRRAERLGGT